MYGRARSLRAAPGEPRAVARATKAGGAPAVGSILPVFARAEVLGGAQGVEGFPSRRVATLEVLVDLRQVVCHALLLLQTTVGVPHATSREASRSSRPQAA